MGLEVQMGFLTYIFLVLKMEILDTNLMSMIDMKGAKSGKDQLRQIDGLK